MAGHSGTTSTLAWLTLASCLGGVVVFELAEGIPLAPTVTAAVINTPEEEADNTLSVGIELPSSALIDDIINRPLFSASRRSFVPPPDEQLGAIQTPAERLSLQLIGTMVAGETRLALLKDAEGDLFKLRQGQEVKGWLVEMIDQTRVRLQRDEEVEWLNIRANLETTTDPRAKALKPTADRDLSGKVGTATTMPVFNEVSGQRE